MPPLKSLYTPIFNANAPSSSSSPSVSPVSPPSTTQYIQTLSRLHLSLASLPPSYELPESRPSTPNTDQRIEKRRQELKGLFEYCGGDPSSGKWGLVWENVRMGSTRSYKVVTLAKQSSNHNNDGKEGGKGRREWLLADTEADWDEWEKKCKEEERVKMKVEMWKKGMDGEHGEGESMDVELPQSLKELYEKKAEEREVVAKARAGKGKGKEKEKKLDQSKKTDPAPLGFPVVKRFSLAMATAAGKKGPLKGKEKETEPRPPSLEGVDNVSPEVVPKPITDLTDIYISPSFPTDLPTSTPKSPRQKPPPIPKPPVQPIPSPPSPFTSSMRPPEDRLPSPQLGKRARHLTPDGTTSSTQALYAGAPTSPPLKKSRTMPEPMSLSSDLDRATTPPPQTSPPISGLAFANVVHPTTPAHQKGFVLGNAKGLPVPSTPERGKPLPTLTDLIASSRKSKPRLRPPSRKKKTNPLGGDVNDVNYVVDSPTKSKARELTTPILENPSPAKSLLSSPASGDECSSDIHPQSIPIAPITHHLTQNPGAFAPQSHSTQHYLFNLSDVGTIPGLQYGGIGTMGTTTTSLARGSSGVWGGGYNSQFDVEGQVDRVSELLERDVDFDGWLKEIPPDPEEDEVVASSQV